MAVAHTLCPASIGISPKGVTDSFHDNFWSLNFSKFVVAVTAICRASQDFNWAKFPATEDLRFSDKFSFYLRFSENKAK